VKHLLLASMEQECNCVSKVFASNDEFSQRAVDFLLDEDAQLEFTDDEQSLQIFMLSKHALGNGALRAKLRRFVVHVTAYGQSTLRFEVNNMI
jgi:hypothetical protein